MNPNDIKNIVLTLNNAQLIIKDSLSFVYLNTERQGDIKKYDLGQGTFTSAISLFALLNFLSKMYVILKNGNKNIINHEHVVEYEKLKNIVQAKNPDDWKRIKVYFKKPRIGEINETDAFTEFVIDAPIDLGLDKTKPNEIKKFWNLYRNKLTHLISLKGNDLYGQMLIQNVVANYIEYPEYIKFLKGRSAAYTVFDITTEEIKEIFSKDSSIDNSKKQYYIKDKCYVDVLKIRCEDLLEWILFKLNKSEFPIENIQILNKWLSSELVDNI